MPRVARPREPEAGPRSRKAGEDDFLSVVQATVDGILVLDERGRVRFANPAAAALLGRDERELDQLPFGVPMTGAGGFAQLDVARPDGTEVAVEMHVAPLRWRGATPRSSRCATSAGASAPSDGSRGARRGSR